MRVILFAKCGSRYRFEEASNTAAVRIGLGVLVQEVGFSTLLATPARKALGGRMAASIENWAEPLCDQLAREYHPAYDRQGRLRAVGKATVAAWALDAGLLVLETHFGIVALPPPPEMTVPKDSVKERARQLEAAEDAADLARELQRQAARRLLVRTG
jgi:hypothetical protein